MGVVAIRDAHRTPPVRGNTAQQVVAAQMTQTPEDLRTHRDAAPPALAAIVMRALERRPADRWQSATDMLDKAGATPGLERRDLASRGGERSRRFGQDEALRGDRWRPAAGGTRRRLGCSVPTASRELHLGRRMQVTLAPGLEIEPAMSPDGRLVAYAAGLMQSLEIRVRRLDGGAELTVAPQSERPQRFPSWSPDGGRIMFGSPRGIEIVSALGGAAKLIVPDVPDPHADPWGTSGLLMPGGWAPDGKSIAFARNDTLYLEDLAGGTPRALAQGGEMHSFAWSPDGRWIACVRGNRQSLNASFLFGNLGAASIWLIPAGGGAPLAVTDDQWFTASPSWVPDGRSLLFVSNRAGGVDLYQARVRSNGKLDGAPVRLTNGLNAQTISVAPTGRWIAYSDFVETSNVWSMPIPSHPPGSVREAEPVTSGNQIIEGLETSPDGKWLLFDSDRSGNQDLYRMALSGSEPERLTETTTDEFWGRWSPKGDEIAFHSFQGTRRHIFVMSADGRDRKQVTGGPDDERTAEWTRDGKSLIYLHNFNGPGTEVRSITRSGDGTWSKPRTIFSGHSYPPVPSPDGRLIALAATGSVVVVGANGGAPRVLVPHSDTSSEPRAAYVDWSPDSRTVYYLAVDPKDRASIWSVSVSGGAPRLMVRFDDPVREWHRFGFAARRGRFYFTVGDRQSDVWAAEVDSPR